MSLADVDPSRPNLGRESVATAVETKREGNARILELWAEGENMSAIGVAVCCTRSAVAGVILRAGATRDQQPIKVAPTPPAVIAPPPPPSRFACLGDALLASAGGCRWPMKDEDGHWFCGGLQSRDRDRYGQVRTHPYCAAQAAVAAGKGTPSERRADAAPLQA